MYILIYVLYFIERRTAHVRYIVKVARDRSTMLSYISYFTINGFQWENVARRLVARDYTRKLKPASLPERLARLFIIAEGFDALATFCIKQRPAGEIKFHANGEGRRLRLTTAQRET